MTCVGKTSLLFACYEYDGDYFHWCVEMLKQRSELKRLLVRNKYQLPDEVSTFNALACL